MTPAPGAPLEAVRFPVTGMTCGACVGRITRAVRRVPGVTGVRVDLAGETVTIRRDPTVVGDAALAGAIEAAGYAAHLHAARSVAWPASRRPWSRFLGS